MSGEKTTERTVPDNSDLVISMMRIIHTDLQELTAQLRTENRQRETEMIANNTYQIAAVKIASDKLAEWEAEQIAGKS